MRQAVRIVLEYLKPFLPDLAQKGLSYVGGDMSEKGNLLERTTWPPLEPGVAVAKAEPLMPRKQ